MYSGVFRYSEDVGRSDATVDVSSSMTLSASRRRHGHFRVTPIGHSAKVVTATRAGKSRRKTRLCYFHYMETAQKQISFATTLASVAASFGAFLTPMVWRVSKASVFLVSYSLSVAWSVLAIAAIVRRQDRMKWIFFGMPFAAYWPAMGTLLDAACRWGHDCI